MNDVGVSYGCSILSLLAVESKMDNAFKEEFENFIEKFKNDFQKSSLSDDSIKRNLKDILHWRIKFIKWVVNKTIDPKEIIPEAIDQLAGLGGAIEFAVIAEAIGESFNITKQLASNKHLKSDTENDLWEPELQKIEDLNTDAFITAMQTFPPAFKEYVGASLVVEWILLVVYLMRDKELPVNAKHLSWLNEKLKFANRIYGAFPKYLEYWMSALNKGEESISLPDLLLSGPVMSDEDYNFYLEKKAHFNAWNQK